VRKRSVVNILVILIGILSGVASSIGIFSDNIEGPREVISVHGRKVTLYGKGAYHHMSEQVAPQGIAQDVVTLFIAIPMLFISLGIYNRGSVRGKILLAGTLAYFLVTYLFFTLMAMYNQLFLLWVINLSLCFYSFLIVFTSVDGREIYFNTSLPNKFIGGFLMFCSTAIALLWLSVIIPPMLKHSVPEEVEHYTTLVVQALDLSILLPASFISGWLLYKRRDFGFIIAPVYIVFLTLLMLALTAKVMAMGILGYNIIPVVYIIPSFALITLICFIIIFSKLKTKLNYETAYTV
jgi:hypothetical protein